MREDRQEEGSSRQTGGMPGPDKGKRVRGNGGLRVGPVRGNKREVILQTCHDLLLFLRSCPV